MLSVGLTVSILIVSARQPDGLPAMSWTRVLSVCVPSAEIVTVSTPFVPRCSALSASPSSWSFQPTDATPEPESVPLSTTEYGVLRQPVGAVGRGVVGSVESSLIVCDVQPLAWPALSTTRVSSVCGPCPGMTTSCEVPTEMSTLPPSMRHSTRWIAEWASVPRTLTLSAA